MRRAAVLLALVLAGCGGGGPTGTPASRAEQEVAERWPQPLRYSLDLAYDAERFALAGEERITLRNTGAAPLAQLWLRTWGNAFGGCDRRFVDVEVMSGGRAGVRRRGCTALEVRLDEPLAPGEGTTIGLRVEVRAPSRPDRFGRFEGAAYFGNALPVLAVADEDGWSLPAYTFRGESFYSLAADWEVRLRLPPGVRAATTGADAGGTIRARAARDFMIVAGPLRETARRVGGVTVRHWTTAAADADARRAIAIARRALGGFGRWYGPYGREELDIVVGPRSVSRGAGLAMEYPELVISPASLGVLGHEIAHQWWYAIVGNDEYREPWLDESFANYSVFRLGGRFPPCPPQPFRPRLTSSMAAFEHAGGDAYVRVVYHGGACSLRGLERAFGRARFTALLRRVVSEHRDGMLTTTAFADAVRDAAPAGVDADALLRRAGIVAP